MIGAPANAPEAGFASGCILTRHQAYPGRKLSARPEMPAIVNRGDDRCRDYRADARQFGEPAACFICPAKGHELCIELLKPAIEIAELVKHIAEDLSREIR
jgi:hypothetical protein